MQLTWFCRKNCACAGSPVGDPADGAAFWLCWCWNRTNCCSCCCSECWCCCSVCCRDESSEGEREEMLGRGRLASWFWRRSWDADVGEAPKLISWNQREIFVKAKTLWTPKSSPYIEFSIGTFTYFSTKNIYQNHQSLTELLIGSSSFLRYFVS